MFSSVKNSFVCNVSVVLLVKNFVDVSNGINMIGVSVVMIVVSEGMDGIFWFIGIVGNIVWIGIFVVSIVFFFLDIYIMVIFFMEIDFVWKGKKEKELEVVKKLRELVDDLEKEMNEIF